MHSTVVLRPTGSILGFWFLCTPIYTMRIEVLCAQHSTAIEIIFPAFHPQLIVSYPTHRIHCIIKVANY